MLAGIMLLPLCETVINWVPSPFSDTWTLGGGVQGSYEVPIWPWSEVLGGIGCASGVELGAGKDCDRAAVTRSSPNWYLTCTRKKIAPPS